MPSDLPAAAIGFEFDVDPALDQVEFDIEFFGHVLQRSANNVDVLRRQVELLGRVGRHSEALKLYYRLVQLRPDDDIARYNLACTLSVLGEVDEALTVLDQALGLGYSDIVHLESDSDLDTIRGHCNYPMILAKHGHSVEF